VNTHDSVKGVHGESNEKTSHSPLCTRYSRVIGFRIQKFYFRG